MTEEQQVVAKLRKTAISEIWVSIKTYEGKRSCDIREHFYSEDARSWLPTKKGASIPVDMLPQAVDAVALCAQSTAVSVAAEISRGKRAKTRFAVCDFKGHMYAEIRIYYRDSDDADWKPGKGVTIPMRLLGQLVDALRIAEDNGAT